VRLINEVTEPDAWIVSDSFEPVFFNVEQTARRRLLMIDEDGLSADAATVPSLAEDPARLETLLSHGARVYFVGDIEAPSRRGWLERYALERVAHRRIDRDRIMLEVWRLTPRSDAGPSKPMD
jgi:hypothetical protein